MVAIIHCRVSIWSTHSHRKYAILHIAWRTHSSYSTTSAAQHTTIAAVGSQWTQLDLFASISGSLVASCAIPTQTGFIAGNFRFSYSFCCCWFSYSFCWAPYSNPNINVISSRTFLYRFWWMGNGKCPSISHRRLIWIFSQCSLRFQYNFFYFFISSYIVYKKIKKN